MLLMQGMGSIPVGNYDLTRCAVQPKEKLEYMISFCKSAGIKLKLIIKSIKDMNRQFEAKEAQRANK